MKTPQELGSLLRVPVEVEGQLDSRLISMRDLLALKSGSLLKLQRSAGDTIDILAGGTIIGYGEIALLENTVCLRLTDMREEV